MSFPREKPKEQYSESEKEREKTYTRQALSQIATLRAGIIIF